MNGTLRLRRFLLAAGIGLAAGGVLALPAAANHSLFSQVSVGVVNGNGPYDAGFGGSSANGLRVFFSTAEKLVSSDTDSSTDVYQRTSGTTTTLVSAGQINGNGPYDAQYCGASPDGLHVFFATKERLVSADTNSAWDIYERYNAHTFLVTAGNASTDIGCPDFVGVSANGTRVFFQTSAKILGGDADSSYDVYERYTSCFGCNSTTILISKGSGAQDALFAGASDDGTKVYYLTQERVVPTLDTDSQWDLYEYDSTLGSTSLVSRGGINGNGPYDVGNVRVSADGRHAFFVTQERLTSDDNNPFPTAEVYERYNGVTTLISKSGTGASATDVGFADNGAPGWVSRDGLHVFFESRDRLVSADQDSTWDIYERFAGTTYLVSAGGGLPGNGAFAPSFVGATPDGSKAFFQTQERLVSQDTDSSYDVYEQMTPGGPSWLVSRGLINGNGPFDALGYGFSADGSRVFFQSSEKLTGDDTDSSPDFYERVGTLTTRLSRGPASTSGNGAFTPYWGGQSSDGGKVFFNTIEKLLPADADTKYDVYSAAVSGS